MRCPWNEGSVLIADCLCTEIHDAPTPHCPFSLFGQFHLKLVDSSQKLFFKLCWATWILILEWQRACATVCSFHLKLLSDLGPPCGPTFQYLHVIYRTWTIWARQLRMHVYGTLPNNDTFGRVNNAFYRSVPG